MNGNTQFQKIKSTWLPDSLAKELAEKMEVINQKLGTVEVEISEVKAMLGFLTKNVDVTASDKGKNVNVRFSKRQVLVVPTAQSATRVRSRKASDHLFRYLRSRMDTAISCSSIYALNGAIKDMLARFYAETIYGKRKITARDLTMVLPPWVSFRSIGCFLGKFGQWHENEFGTHPRDLLDEVVEIKG